MTDRELPHEQAGNPPSEGESRGTPAHAAEPPTPPPLDDWPQSAFPGSAALGGAHAQPAPTSPPPPWPSRGPDDSGPAPEPEPWGHQDRNADPGPAGAAPPSNEAEQTNPYRPSEVEATTMFNRRDFPPPPQWGAPEPSRPQAPPYTQQPPPRPPQPPREGWQGNRPEPQQAGEHPWEEQAHQPASPANWSYVDSIRPNELVPTRKIPPGKGWRKVLYKSSFGLLNFGQSPDERRLAELEAKIRSLLRGRYKIGVLGKGGVGKTTIAAGVGSIFAELRQDDRVVAIDADTAFGKLGLRVDPNAKGSYWELAADQDLRTFADVRSRVGNNPAGLFVLAGESATARRRILEPSIYREATSRLDNHFTLSIIDCGSTMDSAVTREVLRDLDALIVVSSMWVDGASAAAQTMELLANTGYTGLLHRTVVVLNDGDGHADKHTREVLKEQFSQRGQLVVEVPFDRHLRPGGVVDVQNQIDKTTRRRLIEIAAAIAEHFPATSDSPRGRR